MTEGHEDEGGDGGLAGGADGLMSYRPRPGLDPERILVMGVQGVGKSRGLLSVARRMPDAQFHVLDNDFAYRRLLATEFEDVDRVGNVEVHFVDEWDDYLPLIKKLNGTLGPNDWLAVDSMTPTWDAVQGWYTEKIYGKDIDEWFLAVRKLREQNQSDKKNAAMLPGVDWQVINKVYFKLYSTILQCPGNVWLTAELQKVDDEHDGKEIKGLYGAYGVRPKGQKRLGHIVQTVLLMSKSRVGQYSLTTIKDRGRRELEDQPITDFAKDYLMKVAGWRPTKIGG